jgi:hypothetical protein
MDVINAGQLGGVEVTKVITPIRMQRYRRCHQFETRSAFDYKSRVFNVMGGKPFAGAGFRSAINYSDKISKKEDRYFLKCQLHTYQQAGNFKRISRVKTSTTNLKIPMALRQITLRESNNTCDRLGLSVIEYKFNSRNRIWINGMITTLG